VLYRVLLQESLEGDRASGEDNLVGFDLLPITGDGDIHEIILVTEILGMPTKLVRYSSRAAAGTRPFLYWSKAENMNLRYCSSSPASKMDSGESNSSVLRGEGDGGAVQGD